LRTVHGDEGEAMHDQPSGPAAIAAAPPATHPVPTRRTRPLAMVALGAAALVTVLDLVGAALSWPAMDALQRARDAGLSAWDSEATAYDLLGLPQGLAIVGAWVATAVWLGRARSAAEGVRRFRHARSPIWPWLGWVVPVVSLWFPYQVVRDVGKAASPSLAPPPGLAWWWASWLAWTTLSQAAGRVSVGRAGTGELIDAFGVLNTLAAVLSVLALALWVRIVLRVVADLEASVPASA
jgi:hypothetical protein